MIVALQGWVIVVLQGCVIVALQGCVIVVLQGCIIVVLQGCVIVLLRARLRYCAMLILNIMPFSGLPSNWTKDGTPPQQQSDHEPAEHSVLAAKKFLYGFWDNQWFGRNQINLKLKLGAPHFMHGIKNLNLIFF
jgi:hypothetical protein